MQNLHSHKYYSNVYASFKDSHVSYRDYAARCKELGQQVITSVEHGYQGNYPRCWEVAQEEGLKFVFGVEAYWVKDRHEPDNTNAHILILARNEKGMREINKMLSVAARDGFYQKPRVDPELLRTLTPENVLVTTACVSFWGKPSDETGFVRYHYSEEGSDEGIMPLFREIYAHFGASLYLEVQAHDTLWQREINRKCLSLHYAMGIPLIAGLDSHYIHPEQKKERQILREESGIRMAAEDFELSEDVFEDYPDEETLKERFRKQGILNESEIAEAIRNTDIALTFDDIVLDRSRKLPRSYRGMDRAQCAKEYERRVREAFASYSSDLQPEEAERRFNDMWIQEVQPVLDEDQSVYFLLNSDLITLGKKYGGTYTNSGRGSAGSFFSNKLLGLTGLDRFELPVPLYPSRFMTAERLKTSLPDVDMNVSDPEPFVRAQEELMGKGHVAPMVAYGTQKPKSAFRMYARAKDIPMDIQSTVSRQIEAYERAVQNADDEDEKEAIFIEDFVDAQYMQYVIESGPYRGIVVTKSQAPCGYLLYDGDIDSDIGIMRVAGKSSKKVSYCTVIDGYTADAFGYVKNDILTITVAAINAAASSKAGLPYLSAEDLIERTKNDPATWNIFAKGATIGVNQCQGAKTIEKLMRYKPRSLQDMSAFVAAIRPGFKSMVQRFLGRERFSYGIPAFDDLLHNDSSGSSWLLYQEDVMKVLSLAGFPMEETYPIIKAISKKKVKVIDAARERFLKGFVAYQKDQDANIPDAKAQENAEAVWQVLYDSSSYSFNSCVTGDTKIVDEYGCLLSVENIWMKKMAGIQPQVVGLSYDGDELVCRNPVIDVRFAGKHVVYKIVLDSGISVRCTGSHKFPTPDGEKELRLLQVGDWLYQALPDDRGVSMCRIASIKYAGVEDVYDVQMNAPYHNFVANDGIITSNSHSVSVALDAIYGAYLKAHYPHEYYTTLLEMYTAKGDKNKVAEIKDEMFRVFGINISPCRFRQDNRSFSFDKHANTISDALPSIRNLSQAVAQELYDMRDEVYFSFTDLLNDMDFRPAFNATNITVLIRMDYFHEFGQNGKLMEIWDKYRNDKEMGFKKTHVAATQKKRLAALNAFEAELEDHPLSLYEQLSFEAVYYGAPISKYQEARQIYVVTSVDAKYSPKIGLYSAVTGRSGSVKVKKDLFKSSPVSVGDVIVCGSYHRRPRYTFSEGKPTPIPGQTELWLDDYVPAFAASDLNK